MKELGPIVFIPPRSGAVFVCTIPRELGRITSLEIVRGRVVAGTSAGVPFIVPRPVAPADRPQPPPGTAA